MVLGLSKEPANSLPSKRLIRVPQQDVEMSVRDRLPRGCETVPLGTIIPLPRSSN